MNSTHTGQASQGMDFGRLARLLVVSMVALLVLPAVPAAADHAPPPGLVAGSGSLEGTELIEEQTFLGIPCFAASRHVYGLRGEGTYVGRAVDGSEVVYRAELNDGQRVYEGPLRIEVENTEPFFHGPDGTHGADSSCSPATAGTPVPAEFRIFAPGNVYKIGGGGAQVPCVGHGSFSRTGMSDPENWQADWTLDETCVVVGNDAGTPGQGTAPARTAHTHHGFHGPCAGGCLNNFMVDYAQYIPVMGLAVGMGGPGSAFVGDTVTVTAGVTFDGVPVSAASVAFSVAGPAATAPAAFAGPTDANGRAEFTFTAGVAGDYVVTATATSTSHPGVTASGTHTVRFTPRPPPSMTMSGNPSSQTEQNVTTVATVSYEGQPAPGIPVSFTVESPQAAQATPASGTAVTNAAGQASFTFVGNRAGNYTVHAAAAAETLTASHTVRLVIGEMTRADAITLPDDEDRLNVALIDPAGRYAYFAENDFTTKVVKVDLTTFQRVGALSLNANERNVLTAVVDPAGRYAYFGTGVYGTAGKVIKVDLDTFQRVGTITLNANETILTSAIVDPAGRYAYFGTAGSPGRVVKIDLSTFQRVGSITLNEDPAGLEFMVAATALMDPAGRYAYVGATRGSNPALVVRIDLTTFERDRAVTMTNDERDLSSAVIDPGGAHAYFGTSAGLLGTANVIKIDLGLFQRASAITVALPTGSDSLASAVIDPTGGYAYFGTPDPVEREGQVEAPTPEQVVKVDLSPFELVTVLPLAGDGDLISAVMAPDGGHAYFGTWPRAQDGGRVPTPERATKVVKVALTRPPKAELAASGDSYTTAYETTLSVPAPGVLWNDEDTGDGDPLTAGQASDPAGGSVALNPDGSFTYTPDNGFSGTDTFTYTASDGMDYSAPATVSIAVAPPQGPIGRAYNYFTNVSLFGAPPALRGYGQQVCTAPSTPSGCVSAAQAAASASPSVACPAAGGTASATDPDGAKAAYGPAVLFGGIWPEDQGSAPPSGPLTSSVDCQPGQGGRVTATTSVALMPAGSAYPGGVGPGPFIADEVNTTCGAATAPVRVVNGVVETSYYVADDPNTPQVEEGGTVKTTHAVPTNPTPGYTVEGTLDHIGDSFRIVFNEQSTNPDGSRTVLGAHMYLLGPTAVGDMVVGSSTCGPVATTARKAVADFDGDNDTDRSVFRNGAWYAEGQPTAFVGVSGDIAVPGDYDGDGDAEHAVYRNGTWFTEGQPTAYLGLTTDIPVPADYDGDGDTDRAVFRPSVGAWYIDGQAPIYHGAEGDVPVPGDYDGDGDAEVGIWRPAVGGWYIDGAATQFLGLDGDIPVPGDYDGNGTTDRGIWRPAVGGWYIAGQATQFVGLQGDVPVPGDYDGDGDTDRGIWRPAVGGWYIDGQAPAYLGAAGDVPLPLAAAIHRAFFTA